jgi:hypothetical protein
MYKFAATAIGLILASHSAQAAERVFTVTDFDKVQVEGAYRVVLTTGCASAAKASGARAALDGLSVEVEGMTLRIRRDASAWGGNRDDRSEPVIITLATRTLRSASVNGAGSLSVGKVQAMRLDLTVAGSGRIEAAGVQVDNLSLNLLGSGQLTIAGKAKTARAEIHGSGNLEAAALTVDDAQIVSDTAGDVKLAATRSARVTASASGNVEVAGTAACTVKALGTGRIRCGR